MQGRLDLKFIESMSFSTYFRFTSYASVAAATLALFISGGVGLYLTLAFAAVMIAAWKLEGTRWQLTERVALVVILVSLPIFYFDWRILAPYLQIQYLETGQHGAAEVSVLAHLILFLSAVKLLQRKADRDWFFLYLISFFEVLLAAGLTANPVFLATLILYLSCALSTVVAFEIQRARGKVRHAQTRLLVPPDSSLFRKLPMRLWRRRYLETRRLPLVSVGLLVLIVVLALPFFLIAPRTASSALKRGGNGVSGFIGFSDNVTLGQIGQLKSSDEIFMHVRIDNPGVVPPRGLRWRGVALDQFTGKAWKQSHTTETNSAALRSDRLQSSVESARYLELPPNLDPRIGTVTRDVIKKSGAKTWYDAAHAIESYLRENYGYTLELKAAGPDPLADFLFNVKQGHCEYFATAMAVMLRTQGIATRVVNGFLPGEYNEAAGAYTVRQSDAHSWVEVYFPQTNSWVTFDPTPPAGRAPHVRTGLAAQLSKYSEAMELIWFQYVVGYDKQEQHSLVTSLRKELFDLRRGS